MQFHKLWSQVQGGIPLIPLTFSVTGNNQLLLISGSVNPRKIGVSCEVKVFVDATLKGVLKIKNNEGEQHHHVALVSAYIPLTMSPRQGNPYTLLLQPTNLTTTGFGGDVAVAGDDYCDIVLIDAA
jgi:hypothetical protein